VEGTVEAGSTVLINGNEIAVDANGRYKAEIPIRKGQREVEIVAVDKNGNKNIIKKDIGN
jgi:urease alpha subunit